MACSVEVLGRNKGVALITALMFTVLSLVISMSLLYMVTAGVKMSGAIKRYASATNAAYGGSELLTGEIIGKALEFSNYSAGGNPFTTYFSAKMGALRILPESNLSCLHMRLTTPRRFWSPACSVISRNSPDISFQLQGTSGSPYRVYSTIVDTSEWRITSFPGTGKKEINSLAGNSDITSGGDDAELTQGAVVGSGGPPLKSPHYPYVYKIEIQGERKDNPDKEKSTLSVLYAY
jgi:hypothetical protein